jgi:uncharacterized protein YbjT (DUF2867 family)
VNAVSLYAESGPPTFHSVHVEAATRVARLAREVGVGRFIHVSGIAGSAWAYIRSRGSFRYDGHPSLRHVRARRRLRDPDSEIVASSPVFPLFGRGQTQLQPAYVEDVADAIARVMQNTQSPMCYELGGPRVYAYRSLLEVIARHLGIKPLLISIPCGLWHALASVAEMLDKGGLAGSIPSDLARVLSPPTSPLSEPRPGLLPVLWTRG